MVHVCAVCQDVLLEIEAVYGVRYSSCEEAAWYHIAMMELRGFPEFMLAHARAAKRASEIATMWPSPSNDEMS